VVGVVAAVAIAVAAPYLAPLALGALGITATATAVAIATAVISIGLSLAVSFAFRALGVGTPSAKDQVGPPQVFRQSISNSFIVYGKRRVGGLLVFFHAKQDAGGAHFRYFVVAVAGHQCSGLVDFMLGDEVVTVDGSGMVTSGKYANAAWLWFERGTPADAANATFVSECDGKWTTAHQGKGVAKFYAKFKLTDNVVEAGMPNMTAIIEGRDEILDPRTATTGYSRNATLIFYDFNRMPREEGGFGAYDDEIPDDAWVSAQANVCDETVNGAARYAIDAVIQTGAAPSEIRDVLVVSQAGTYTYSGGKHLMRPGYWVPPTATLAEDDIAGPIQVSPFMPADAAASEVQGTYISPDSNYTAAPLTTWAQSPAPDDVRQVDIDLAFVTNKDQGDRILRIMGKRAQCEKTVTWPENIVGLKRRAMDTVQVDKADYGLNNYAWTITSWQFAADFGAVMSLREENADIYTDEAAVAPVTPPTVTQPDPIVQSDTAAVLRNSYPKGVRITAIDAGTDATVKIDGGSDGADFVIDYATTPPEEITVPDGTVTALAYDTTYYPFADVDAPGDATPTYGVTTVYGDALNSSAHPLRIFLGQAIRTPLAGGTGTTGGGTGGGYSGGGLDPGDGSGLKQYP
jgi:hypothetical protein